MFLPKLTAHVTDGRMLLTSSTDAQKWQFDDVNATIECLADSAPLSVEAECRVMPLQVEADGQIKLQQPGQLTLIALIDLVPTHYASVRWTWLWQRRMCRFP